MCVCVVILSPLTLTEGCVAVFTPVPIQDAAACATMREVAWFCSTDSFKEQLSAAPKLLEGLSVEEVELFGGNDVLLVGSLEPRVYPQCSKEVGSFCLPTGLM